MEARWWHRRPDGRIACDLCPRACELGEGQAGVCGVRRVRSGVLVSEVHGLCSGLAVDPIEKKPLYHVAPGREILSYGTIGCNLACSFCQNWTLSREKDPSRLQAYRPADLVRLARARECVGVAFTYNEPIISAESCLEVAAVFREAGLLTAAVTAGYIAGGARETFFAAMDAANVDLKGFTEAFYRSYCGVQLGPVLETLEYLAHSPTWLEVTTLLLPGANDATEEIDAQTRWMAEHLGPEVPLHLSAFHPDYRLRDRPPTSLATLRRAREIALGNGLRYVYTGNVRDEEGSGTQCPKCGKRLIERMGFAVTACRLEFGRCPGCRTDIPGRW